MDFLRVSENEAIRIRRGAALFNQEKSPAGKAAGVVVTHELTEVGISCLPRDLPEFIEIDLVALEVGDIVHLSEIKLPNGVEIPELKLGKEHDVAVVIAKHAKEEVEVEASKRRLMHGPSSRLLRMRPRRGGPRALRTRARTRSGGGVVLTAPPFGRGVGVKGGRGRPEGAGIGRHDCPRPSGGFRPRPLGNRAGVACQHCA